MTFYIDYENDTEKEPFDFDIEKLFQRVAEETLNIMDCPYEVEISLLITDDAGINEINMEQRQIDRPTDVLSFPMHQYETPGAFEELDDCDDCFNPESGELILGDIVISKERAILQAYEYGHSIIREIAFLIAHSMLHLIGYDHMTKDEADEMFALQENILSELGITRQ